MEAKEYKFSFPPKIYTKYRNVVYVEDKRDERINTFIYDNYDEIKSIFKGYGLEFQYLPAEIESDYFIKYLFSSEEVGHLKFWDLEQASNSELLKYFSDEEEKTTITPSLFFNDKKRQGNKSNRIVLKAVPIEYDKNIFDNIMKIANYISSFFPPKEARILYDNGICCSKTPDYIESAESSFSRVIKLAKENGIPDSEIMDIVKRIIRRESKADCIIIKKDYRIFIDEANKKEVKLTALPKALYLFFLKHPEGIYRDDLFKYMPEISYIYLKVRTRRVAHPLETIERMLVGDQFANNLSFIRDAFQKTYHMERNSIYSIEPDKYHPKLYSIGIADELRNWQCPNILNKSIPTLPQKVSNIIRATWKILHELGESKIDEAIGNIPPKCGNNATKELDIFK